MSFKIIILSGKAESGKNESASIISKLALKNGKKVVSISYAFYLKEYAKKILNWDGNESTKPRCFLQEIGTNIKNNIDDKFLIKRVIEDIKIYSNYFDLIIITDARFKEEIMDIKNEFKDVKVIRIIGKENSLTKIEKEHITETALDNYNNFDYVINNPYDVLELTNILSNIYKEV